MTTRWPRLALAALIACTAALYLWNLSATGYGNAFYAAAETAYAIVQTGERRFYGNILLTKGVVAAEEQA